MAKKRAAEQERSADEISIRIDLAAGGRIGPGKIAVLETIARAGSISGAGRELGMSYRRTWMLVEELNALFARPVVETAAGGSGGGGARLTELGQELVACYRGIEAESTSIARRHLAALQRRTA